MAERVLGSCMQKLVSAVRLAVENSHTTLDVEFRRSMLAEAHVLAVECKNFLGAVDSARLKILPVKLLESKKDALTWNTIFICVKQIVVSGKL